MRVEDDAYAKLVNTLRVVYVFVLVLAGVKGNNRAMDVGNAYGSKVQSYDV